MAVYVHVNKTVKLADTFIMSLFLLNFLTSHANRVISDSTDYVPNCSNIQFFTYLDLTGKPAALLKYKIQEEKGVPVSLDL